MGLCHCYGVLEFDGAEGIGRENDGRAGLAGLDVEVAVFGLALEAFGTGGGGYAETFDGQL